MEMMRSLAHERGRAVVIVTHDSRVMEFADRTIRIEDGAIADPNLEEIKVSPALLSPSPTAVSLRSLL